MTAPLEETRAEYLAGPHIPSLLIENFRGIRELRMEELRQVTIIAGRSGAGRTSLLDAAQVHATRGDHQVLREILLRNDEILLDEGTQRMIPAPEALFSGYNTGLEVRIGNGDPYRDIRIRTEPADEEDRFGDAFGIITVRAGGKSRKTDLERSGRGRAGMFTPEGDSMGGIPCTRLGPEPASNQRIAELWDRSMMNGEDRRMGGILKEATRGRAERVVCIGDAPHRRPITTQEGIAGPVPLRSLGTAVTQAAALIMAFQSAQGGLLLLDQPENGTDPAALNTITGWMISEAPCRNTQVIIVTNSGVLVSAAQEAAQTALREEGTLPVIVTQMPG